MSLISDNTSSCFSRGESYYDIFGIKSTATLSEITNIYKKLTDKWNPNNNNHPGANRKFLDINNAYQVLSDREARKRYDQTLINRTKFTFDFKEPFDVYEEYQKIREDIQHKFKDNLENVLCDLSQSNSSHNYEDIQFKTRTIIEKQLILINS